MKLTGRDYDFLYKKLEYRFKKSGHELVDKIKNHEELTGEDIKLLLRRLEYTFRKSGNEIIQRLVDMIELKDYYPVKYSNIKQYETRIKREDDKKEKKLKSFKDYNKL